MFDFIQMRNLILYILIRGIIYICQILHIPTCVDGYIFGNDDVYNRVCRDRGRMSLFWINLQCMCTIYKLLLFDHTHYTIHRYTAGLVRARKF